MKSTFNKILMSAGFGLAICLFFSVRYSYHVYYQELFQLFEFTGAYFLSTVSRIGGLADWMSRFLTQFFYFFWAGTIIYALVILAIQYLTFHSCANKALYWYAFSFMPAVLVWVFFLSGESALSGPLALFLSLVSFNLVLKIKNDRALWILSFILTPILYFLLGPISIVFTILLVFRKRRILYLLNFILFFAAVLLAFRVTPYPLDRLLYGLDYYKVHSMFPIFLWIAAGLVLLTVGLSECMKGTDKWNFVVPVYIFSLSLAFLSVERFSSFSHESEMKYQMLTIKNSWNKITTEALEDEINSNNKLACLNLALAKAGHLGNHMFDFPQTGGQGLIPEGQATFLYGLCTSEIYWQLGMVGQAARFAFEAQSCVPDFQHSAYCFKRLAQTNIVNGKYELAGRYLSHLRNSLFHKKWAEEQLEIIKSSALNDNPEYGWRLNSRFRDKDFMFTYERMNAMLEITFFENVDNKLVLDYLLGWCLLTRDIDTFVTYCPFEGYLNVPRAFQDAYLIKWTETHSALDVAALPEYISMDAAYQFDKAESPYLKYYYAQ